MAEKFVSLVRVSTSRQGDSGLGLLAQKEQVEQHIRAVGGELVQEFVEVESGRKIQIYCVLPALPAFVSFPILYNIGPIRFLFLLSVSDPCWESNSPSHFGYIL